MKHDRILILILLAITPFATSAVADSAVLGPQATSDKPIVVDSIGEIETTFRALGTPGTRSKPSRWLGELQLIVRFADIATDDSLLITIKKGRKVVARAIPCQARWLFPEHQLAYFDCLAPGRGAYDKALTTSGAHSIELSLRQVVAGVEHKVFATLEVHIEELKKGSSNNPVPAWGTNHDRRLTVSTIEEKTESAGQGPRETIANALGAADRTNIPYLSVHTWFKREKRLERTRITCMFNGKRVAEADASGGTSYSSWSFLKKGKPDRRNQTWAQAEYRLYALHPRTGPDNEKGTWAKPQHWMHENPGEYRCVITGEGEVLKELTFTVGPDGEIVKPACQLASINTLRTVTLVATRDRKLVQGKANLKLGKKAGYEGRARWARGCPLNK